MNQGALMTVYFGHGSEVAWASEGLLKASYVSKFNNQKLYTILNSYACSVGRFDLGNVRSLSEIFVVTPRAGAIASVGAARETYAWENETFATYFVVSALAESGRFIGTAYMGAKNSIVKAHFSRNRQSFVQAGLLDNSENFVLFGEPVIRMPVVSHKISLDAPVDSVHALDKMKLSGTVSGLSSGNISLTLREGRTQKVLYLLGNNESPLNVDYDGSLIYSETVPVVGGRFETEFVTPKKLNFGDSLAELRAWAYSSNDVGVARYREGNINISGVSAYADSINDKEPPTIRIQSCISGATSSFAQDQEVKLQTPACLQVVVEDETAIDFREQPDEGIIFEMEGLEDPYHPAPFLEQSSRRAIARKALPVESYPPGKYVFKVRAMDVLGNVNSKKLNIEITESMQTGISDVFNAPNPMGKKGTTFYFKNLAVNQVTKSVNIFIYNQHGRLVKVIKNAESGITHWDGKDNYGRLLANGLYHYVVRAEVEISKNKTTTWSKKQKLLISR